ncbi:hypothetical protein N7495_004458 [Penicillium taxi]|uniref:uncharacterized protein n=1 Tax=Penicillium taxi TaxID=168475 RepID=UPI0025457DE1|nr:uncharacterized protein N7495_004458 [Penicillium taxi]KAJ5899714.1 hypothetical protein N7495_004458 [Penicillium taxi]
MVTEVLLSLKVDLQAQDHQGLMLLDIVIREKVPDVANLLLGNGAVSRIKTQSSLATPSIQELQLQVEISSSTSFYIPHKPKDQLQAAFLIKVASQRSLPPSIIGYIFDIAEYWIQSKVQVARPMLIDERTVFAVQYARTPPIKGYPGWPVRQLIFKAVSYEENIHIHNQKQAEGTSDRAYTWWEAAKVEATGPDSKEAVGPIFQTGPICFWNMHMGSQQAQTHSCTWPRHGHMLSECGGEEFSGRGEPVVFYWSQDTISAGCLHWIRELRPGMRIALIPKASFSNKINRVFRAEMMMYLEDWIYDTNNNLTPREPGAIIEYLVERYDTSRKNSFEPCSKEAQLARQWPFFQASGQGPYYGQACWFKKFHPERVPSALQRCVNEINRVSGIEEDGYDVNKCPFVKGWLDRMWSREPAKNVIEEAQKL